MVTKAKRSASALRHPEKKRAPFQLLVEPMYTLQLGRPDLDRINIGPLPMQFAHGPLRQAVILRASVCAPCKGVLILAGANPAR